MILMSGSWQKAVPSGLSGGVLIGNNYDRVLNAVKSIDSYQAEQSAILALALEIFSRMTEIKNIDASYDFPQIKNEDISKIAREQEKFTNSDTSIGISANDRADRKMLGQRQVRVGQSTFLKASENISKYIDGKSYKPHVPKFHKRQSVEQISREDAKNKITTAKKFEDLGINVPRSRQGNSTNNEGSHLESLIAELTALGAMLGNKTV